MFEVKLCRMIAREENLFVFEIGELLQTNSKNEVNVNALIFVICKCTDIIMHIHIYIYIYLYIEALDSKMFL